MQAGDKLSLNFSLTLEDGAEIDSNFDAEPVSLVLGSGDMLPGFEAVLQDFSVGQQSTVTLAAEDAFGVHSEQNLQSFKPGDFASGLELELGLVVGFTDAAGGEVPGVITAIEADEIVVDFNHPLAGRAIVFTALIHSVDSPA